MKKSKEEQLKESVEFYPKYRTYWAFGKAHAESIARGKIDKMSETLGIPSPAFSISLLGDDREVPKEDSKGFSFTITLKDYELLSKKDQRQKDQG